MERASTVWTRSSWLLLLGLFLVNVYRARTQSITIDEAYTYNQHISKGWISLLTSYDANHHVLNSYLSKLSLAAFGLSEFSLRLPSLALGTLYFAAIFQLSRRVFGSGWFLLLAVAALALNPFVLDHLSAARGYGMALAFWMWALLEMTRYLARKGPVAALEVHEQQPADLPRPSLRFAGSCLEAEDSLRRLYRAALALALGTAANLSLLLPALALGAVFVLLATGDLWLAGKRSEAAREAARARDHLFVPAATVLFAIVVLPLTRAEPSLFYFGAPTLAGTFRSVIELSFFPRPLSGVPVWLGQRFSLAPPALIAAAALAWTAVALRWLRGRRLRALEEIDRFFLLSAGAMLATLMALFAARHAFGVLYPLSRTALYWAPLVTLMALALAEKSRRWRPLWAAGCLLIAASVALFVLQFSVSRYAEWGFDAGTSRIVSAIRRQPPRARPVRIVASWELEPSLNFYRQMHQLERQWEPVDRRTPEEPADYRVLLPRDHALIDKLRLRVLYRDELSGAVLAQ